MKEKIILASLIIVMSLSACTSNFPSDLPKGNVSDYTNTNYSNIQKMLDGKLEKETEKETETIPQATHLITEASTFSVSFNEEPLENTFPTNEIEVATQTPTATPTDSTTSHSQLPENCIFAVVTKDTTITVKDESSNQPQIVSAGKNVIIIKEQINSYLIKWYEKTAIIDKNAVKLYDISFIPNFSETLWIGIESSSLSYKRYGVCLRDTEVITPDSLQSLYKGQKVAITEIGDTTYVIEWYGKKAFAELEDIELYPETYEPIFESGSWAGCITDSSLSYYNTERYGICVNDTDIVTPTSIETLYKGQRVHIKEIGDTTYVIEWYNSKAFIKAEDIELYPETYEPIFESGSWAGCIKK